MIFGCYKNETVGGEVEVICKAPVSFWLKNVIARWYLKRRWIFFINQTGTWLLRTCLVASCDAMTMSRTQNRFLGWVVWLEADRPPCFRRDFSSDHWSVFPWSNSHQDNGIRQKDFQLQHCSGWMFDLNLLQLFKQNRFPIYNKTLQCCKNARFPKNFPCFQPSSPWRGQLLLGLFLVVGLNDEIEILSAVSYIFFHWILSSRPGWRYHPGMRWEWMGLGDRAQSLSSVKWWVSENDGMIWERKVL